MSTSGARLLTNRYADLALAVLLLGIVAIMIVPVPTALLDVLLAANISLAALMLLVAMTIPNGLAFAAMPTVLLVTTLYRLALNVSSTRLILLQAD
ncbi:MAG TPA: FHIPEP family type III secretion protein, partial [Polyangiales bacterium]|nr:FHIPEP family type III secretion protein [Polyangiales bacterium]